MEDELGGEDYVIVKDGEEGSAGATAVEGGYRGDLAGGEAAGGSKAAMVAPGEPTKKGGSGDMSMGKKGKVQNGKVAASAVAAARGKKLGLSQSASFPARGSTSTKKGGTVAVAPKQAKPEGKGAVPNKSEAATGRAAEKKANSARTPIARRSLLKHRP